MGLKPTFLENTLLTGLRAPCSHLSLNLQLPPFIQVKVYMSKIECLDTINIFLNNRGDYKIFQGNYVKSNSVISFCCCGHRVYCQQSSQS